MKIYYKLVTILLLFFLISLTFDFPVTGDLTSPANLNVSPYYLENSVKQTHIPNVVTTVLADYRGFDTLFETSVILTAGIALILILFKSKRQKYSFSNLPRTTKGTDLVCQNSCKLAMPLMQLFALYVIAHGHYSPGGGFQGGVILAASFIFYAISFGVPNALNRFFKNKRQMLAYLGVLIYAGVGALCVILKKKFLEYVALKDILRVSDEMAHSYGVLFVEIGVALTISIIMFACYVFLATGNSFDDENL